MIALDFTAPLYTQNGDQWFALREPDGTVWYNGDGDPLVVDRNNKHYRASRLGYVLGTNVRLSNTKPKRDICLCRGLNVDNTIINIRYGYRDGKPFAEVVE